MYDISDGGVKKGLRISPTILPGATVGLVGLAAQGPDIPFLRQIVSFGCLVSLSCVFVLGVLKGCDIGSAESLLYSFGLSRNTENTQATLKGRSHIDG